MFVRGLVIVTLLALIGNAQVGFLRSTYWKVLKKLYKIIIYFIYFTFDAVVFTGGIVKKRTISIYLQCRIVR